MTAAFIKAFSTGLALTAVSICGVGIGGAWLMVETPRERYSTAAFSFELPPGWSCRQEGTETVCRLGKPPSDAIVILTMKYRSPHETMASYEAHLRSPMPAVGRDGQAELVSLRRTKIAGSDWIEGVLRDSEVHNYETTYLAGNTAEVAILFTLSVHAEYRMIRSVDLGQMMRSLVVYQRGAR